tara:strand:+ start:596 stop:871 length:276 start_codon:yes stop_codon:yes gene_type:complete
MESQPIRYYAKENAKGRTFYFGGSHGHRRDAKSLGDALRFDLQLNPDVKFINGPEPDWDNKYHSDGYGKYHLRELTETEEEQLLIALHGSE